MSCNRCSTISGAPALDTGAPDIEASWAGNRDHPQFCGKCHAFLRSDGGCTKCDSATAVPSDGETSPDSDLRGFVKNPLPAFLKNPAALEGNAGLGSAAIKQLAEEIRAGKWKWDGDPPQYPNVVTILSDPKSQPHISDEDRDTVLRSYRPGWYENIENYATDPEARPLHDDEAWEKTKASLNPAWYKAGPSHFNGSYEFRKALTPADIDKMSHLKATLALERVFKLSQAGEWGGDSSEETWEMLTRLYAKADLGRLDADTVTQGFREIMANSSKEGRVDLVTIAIGNPTSPPEIVAVAAEEVSFDKDYKQADAAFLASHPNLGTAAQEWMANSPKVNVRHALATSPQANETSVNRLLRDPNNKVAMAALRNTSGPHAKTAADNRSAGISDKETLQILRRKTHSWQSMPRCGQCGAWTKRDGVCNNKRCGGVGRVMATPEDAIPKQGAFKVPAPLQRTMKGWVVKPVVESWQAAQKHGRYPDEWKSALPAAISELAATGRWESPTGEMQRKDGFYFYNGVPIPATSAGDAIKTYFAILDQANVVDRAVVDDKGDPTGETVEEPRWRYSEGYNAIVDYNSKEPDLAFIQGRDIEAPSGSPATLPTLPAKWRPTLATKDVGIYEHNYRRLAVHGPDSKQYVYLREGENFQVSGKTLNHTLGALEPFAASDASRPVFTQAWGIPANQNSQRDLIAPNGVWVAADGFRLMAIAHDGDEITNQINATPSIRKVIPDDAQVTMGSGMAFRGAEGHLMEAETDAGDFVDYNLIIPIGEPAYKFRLTDKIPPDLIKASDRRLGVIEADKGEVFITLLGSDEENSSKAKSVGRVKIGESNDKEFSGSLAGINPAYLNDVEKTQPEQGKKGSWEIGVHTAASPLTVKHSSRKGLGAIMPMHVKEEGWNV